MSNKRTGGMTAVAVLNFIFGGLAMLTGLWATLTGHALMSRSLVGGETAQFAMLLVGLGLLGAANGAVGILSGIGVLSVLSWGRVMGLIFAGVTILTDLIGHFIPRPDQAAESSASDFAGKLTGTLIGMIYPVVLLYLFNKTSWREAFRSSYKSNYSVEPTSATAAYQDLSPTVAPGFPRAADPIVHRAIAPCENCGEVIWAEHADDYCPKCRQSLPDDVKAQLIRLQGKCRSCGAPLPNTIGFCTSCGTSAVTGNLGRRERPAAQPKSSAMTLAILICLAGVLVAGVLAVAVFIYFSGASKVLFSTSASDALRQTQELFSKQFTKCGDSYYKNMTPWGLHEFAQINVRVEAGELTEADQRNGTEWKGSGIVTSGLVRRYDSIEHRWSDWQTNDMMVTPNGIVATYRLEKRQGKWTSSFGNILDDTIGGPGGAQRIQMTCDQVP